MNVRRKWKSVVWIAAVVCGMVMAETSRAGVMYEYVTDSPTYTINGAGGFVNVLLYLKETLTNGSTSLITSDGGMLGAGVGVSRLAAGLPSSPATLVTDASGVTRNTTDFGGPGGVNGLNGDGNPSATDLSFNESIAPPPGGHPAALGNNAGGTVPSVTNEIYIGSVKIQGGNVQGNTTFAVRVHDNQFFGNTLTNNNFYDLDVTNNGGTTPVYTGAADKTNTFVVTTNVPEPASFGLLVGVGALGLVRRRRA